MQGFEKITCFQTAENVYTYHRQLTHLKFYQLFNKDDKGIKYYSAISARSINVQCIQRNKRNLMTTFKNMTFIL